MVRGRYSEVELLSKSSETELSRGVVNKGNSRSRSRTPKKVSLTGATLKSILKRKGDQTPGKKSISSRKSSIKFNKHVSRRNLDSSSDDDVFGPGPGPSTKTRFFFRNTSNNNNLSHDPEIIKSVIESTLLQSAEILSEFTENTITQAASYVNNFFAPDRAAINKLRQQRRPRNRPWSGTASVSSVAPGDKVKPDISKFPASIVELLKSDSDSSITSKKEVKNYHTRKLALRQANAIHKSNPAVPVKVFADSRAPNIVLISAPDPIKLEAYAATRESQNKKAKSEPSKVKDESTDTMFDLAALESSLACARKIKRDPRSGLHQPANTNAKLLRKPHKLHLGVEKGSVFVVGPRTKIPYVNTFGEQKELHTNTIPLKEKPSTCKWILNIGNFHDEELSFSLFEKNLTVTGFRHPTLRYPDGQTVSETVGMPSDFDVKNLRVYRPKDKSDLLVLEEADYDEQLKTKVEAEVVEPPSMPLNANTIIDGTPSTSTT